MSVDLFETFYTLIGAWKDAGHAKLPPKVRREMRPVVAKIAWNSALQTAHREVAKDPKHDHKWRVTVAAANATFLAEGDPIPVTYLPDYPAPYDHMNASLRRKAEQALEQRKRNLSRYRQTAEDLYERWIKWTGEVDSDLTKRQVEVDQYIERQHREAGQRAEERRAEQVQQIRQAQAASRRKADAELQRLRDETQTRRESFERGLDAEAKARRGRETP